MLGPFDYAFQQTLGFEGGWSDDPDDRGGRTKYGITEAVYLAACRRGIIRPVAVNIVGLTVDQAKAIYLHYYWNAISLNEVKNSVIASEIFDTAVNMGRKGAVLICQCALNFLGEKLEEDGIMGRKTIEALNKWGDKDARALFICLNGFQFMQYVVITKKAKSQIKFARGWTKRVQSYQT